MISNLSDVDNLIIYFSGHGHYEQPTDIGYWIPYDAVDGNYSSYFANAQLLDYIKRIKTRHIFLISDSCFSRSILTEYNTDQRAKNLSTLYHFNSRWALTAGQFLVYTRNGFAETILLALQNSLKDLLVSDLIQTVKEAFRNNEKQTPQGLPLNRNLEKNTYYTIHSEDPVFPSSG